MSTVIHRSFSVLPESVVADRVRVVLADRPDVVREGIARLLGEQDDLSLVAVADDLIEASRAARAHRPDVIVTDLLRLLSDGDGADMET